MCASPALAQERAESGGAPAGTTAATKTADGQSTNRAGARSRRASRERRRALRFRVRVRAIPSWGRSRLRGIAWCESRNDPRAVGGGGAYRGLYQFSFSTWYAVGGKGDPVVAPRSEQTWRAWRLLKDHGSGHWPVCG